MNNQTRFSRFAAITAILSAPVGLTTWLLVAMAVNFDMDLVSEMADVIRLGARASGFFHLAWSITDAFGYAILLAPAALYLWRWLKPYNPNFVTLYALFGFAYILTAAIVVYMMAGVVPPLMRAYSEATTTQRETLLVGFQNLFDMLYYGIGALNWFFGGIWWLGTGLILRQKRLIFGNVTTIVGILSLVVWLEQTFRIDSLIIVETPFFFLILIWAVWIGILILQRGENFDVTLEPVEIV
jgi:hypothetical protein